MSAKALRLLRIERTVSSLRSLAAFYGDALGFDIIGTEACLDPDGVFLLEDESARFIDLSLGAQILRLTEFDSPGAAYPDGSASADLWFQHLALVTPDMDTAYARLRRYREIPISENGPQCLPPATGSVTAYKFRDPDRHPLELIHFPPGTGDARWQRKAGASTIGIDHSALSVSSAGQSIDFYCGILGMKVATRQTNRGAEQERLDNLGDDIVEVVALAFDESQTPHIELLAYQSPKGCRLPSPAQPRDIVADRLVCEVIDLAAILEQLDKDSIVNKKDSAALIRDPDGHLLILEELSRR